MAAGDVFVHLFEWKWTDIANECEHRAGAGRIHRRPGLAAAGAQHHAHIRLERALSAGELQHRPQPLGHGRRVQDMVKRCANVGVGIYVDAVINHMTNFPSPGVGSNGTAYSKYNYPGLYAPTDFHRRPAPSPTTPTPPTSKTASSCRSRT